MMTPTQCRTRLGQRGSCRAAAILLLSAVGCPRATWAQATLISTSECGDPKIGDFIEDGADELVERLEGLDVEVSREITIDRDGHALQSKQGFGLLIYIGHGERTPGGPFDSGSSRICLPVQSGPGREQCSAAAGATMVAVDDLLGCVDTTANGLVVVVDACESAQVDPTRAGVPASVISASPFVVSSTSRFRERLAQALMRAGQDPNCDGLVTDEELFEGLRDMLAQRIDARITRAQPRLRRNATSHIPLPIAPKQRRECADVRARIDGLLTRTGADPFWSALRTQRELRPTTPVKQSLPHSPCDYYLITGSPSDAESKEILSAARDAGLCELPLEAREEAELLGRFAIFAELYELQVDAGWVRIRNLRDRSVVATREVSELGPALPRRVFEQLRMARSPEFSRALCAFRGAINQAPGWEPVVCPGDEAQCFVPTSLAQQTGIGRPACDQITLEPPP